MDAATREPKKATWRQFVNRWVVVAGAPWNLLMLAGASVGLSSNSRLRLESSLSKPAMILSFGVKSIWCSE
jgi:hypothetical protein